MNNDEERKQKIFDEIVAEAQRRSCKKREGEFSSKEFANLAGINKDAALKILRENVDRGLLSVRKTRRGEFYSVV